MFDTDRRRFGLYLPDGSFLSRILSGEDPFCATTWPSPYDNESNCQIDQALADLKVNLNPPDEPAAPTREDSGISCPPSPFDLACVQMDLQASQALAELESLGEGYTPRGDFHLEALACGETSTVQEEAFSRAQKYLQRRRNPFALPRICRANDSESGSELEHEDDGDQCEGNDFTYASDFWTRLYAFKTPKPKPEYYSDTFILRNTHCWNRRYAPSYDCCYSREIFLSEGNNALVESMGVRPRERLGKLDAGLFPVVSVRREAVSELQITKAMRMYASASASVRSGSEGDNLMGYRLRRERNEDQEARHSRMDSGVDLGVDDLRRLGVIVKEICDGRNGSNQGITLGKEKESGT